VRYRLFVACFATVASLASPALAESHATALVRLLHTPGRAHPLADASGRIPVSVALPPGAVAPALGLLEVAPGVGAVRLAPEEVGAFAAAHPDLAIGVAPRLRPLLDVSPLWTQVTEFREATYGRDGRGAIIGIVDTGLDVRHPDFLTKDGHTRVAWLLAAAPPKGLHPDLEAKFGCTDPNQSACAVYAREDIDAVIAAGSDELADAEGHGTHVASIAAGNGGPSVDPKPRFVGMAPEATIIVAAPPQSNGFYDTDILNAARFVFDRADSMGLPLGCTPPAIDGTPPREAAGQSVKGGTSPVPATLGCVPVDCTGKKCARAAPAVLNLSLGSDYGPHDGTSPIEKGLLALVGDDKQGRAIVVAAGNSGELVTIGGKGPYGIHTEVHVFEGETTRVPIRATAAATDGAGFVWITFRPGDAVSVGLEGPGGSTWVGLTGAKDQGSYQKGHNKGGVVNNLPSANDSITPETNSAVVVFSGPWAQDSEFAVVLRGTGDAQLWLTAQKDAAESLFFERGLRHGTINVPAAAPGLLGVGCTVNRVQWRPLVGMPVMLDMLGADPNPFPDSTCFFSSEGPTPTGVQKPEISAPGGFVAGAMSPDADPRLHPGGLFDICPMATPYCALLDDRHALAQGTSMSAPHVAGAVALLMELDPSLTQARATQVLQAGARRSIGHIPDLDQLGPGSLDVAGARLALLDAMAAPTDADPKTSWYTLSSTYARPDTTWPVWGTVELRNGDGSVAAGIDGSKLAFSIQGGGAVYQALTQVKQGLFHFAVAGRPADLGATITLDVTYGGVSLGTRALPVGYDVWSATDTSMGAVGGCACMASGQGGRRTPAALVLAALAVVAVAARGRARRRRCGAAPSKSWYTHPSAYAAGPAAQRRGGPWMGPAGPRSCRSTLRRSARPSR
jgi:subtilisin family serine protease